MKRIFTLTLALFLSAATALQAQQTLDLTLVHDGLTRQYQVYIPQIYNPANPVPLVLNLHGYTSANWQQMFYGEFRPIADTANFIIVAPNGTANPNGDLYWNSGFGTNIDDIGFLSDLIDTVSANYNIDPSRVYSTGMSNGGFMSITLACALSERIAAIASVTGTMTPQQYNNCNPTRIVPMMQMHGTADGTVPYTGSPTMTPIDSVVNFWVNLNQCPSTPAFNAIPNVVTNDNCTAEHYVYGPGFDNHTVEFYKILGGGHSWPGAPLNINVTNMDFNASQEIWRFFRQYRIDGLSTVKPVDGTVTGLEAYPNPANAVVFLRGANTADAVSIYNIAGQCVRTTNYSAEGLNVSGLAPGVYIVSVLTGSELRQQRIVVSGN